MEKKIILFSMILILCLFLVLEAGSRVVYSIYARSPAYLTYGFNSLFNRLPGRDAAKGDKQIFRIACFGGSTTTGWPDMKRNYPLFLQQYLQKKFPDKEIIVENFGIASATPVEATYLLRASIDMDMRPMIHGGLDREKIDRLCGPERYQKVPDLLFLYSHVNATFIENLRLKKILPEKEYSEIKFITPKVAMAGKTFTAKLAFGLNHFLKTRSFFYYALGRIIFWFQHDRYIFPKTKIDGGRDVFLTVLRIQDKISRHQKKVKTANFEDSLDMAVYTAKRLKIPIILGTEPIAIEKYNDIINEDFAVIHEINANVIKKVCYENGVPIFDAVELFRKTQNSSRFFTTDLMHLNPEGDKFLGEKIGDFIIEEGYIK